MAVSKKLPVAPVSWNMRAAQLGIITDLCLTGLKLVGGWAFKSKSLSSDGWHSADDLVTDMIALVVVLATQHLRRTNNHVSAAEILEGVASLFASGALVLVGVNMVWQNKLAIGAFTQRVLLTAGDAHDSDGLQHLDIPDLHAVRIAIITIAMKEWLYRKSE
ncbi:hypothetical protein FSARC_8046 [Fusarium sarcochroum]|uniref:Cation efflux protein transmembrane domain-containing protein n=1 Tax=Fusarium sarcochroum TaxID=1208366 RepID=A0A8H4TTS0_9HYPO|nr:hypothetical protein FSARC_8046 [Fusarium sarcochroum]